MGLGKGDARVHQSLVLFVITAVVAQPASPGELDDLFLHELLFVVAVAQAFLQAFSLQAQG